MKVKIEMDLTPAEFQEVFIPGDKQQEFMYKTYDAYVEALGAIWMNQIDPHKVFDRGNKDKSN